jgi:hypothetical protein
MKIVKYNDFYSESKAAIYILDKSTFGKHYWAHAVTVCEAKTKRLH